MPLLAAVTSVPSSQSRLRGSRIQEHAGPDTEIRLMLINDLLMGKTSNMGMIWNIRGPGSESER